jgi:hypothetical protein
MVPGKTRPACITALNQLTHSFLLYPLLIVTHLLYI